MDSQSSATRARASSKHAVKKPVGEKECKAKMLKLLSIRDYSISNMRGKLADSGFGEDDIDGAIDFAVESGLMDDSRYAEAYIASKKELGWGRGRIERALDDRGVDCGELEDYPDAFFPQDEELERAKRCLRSHRTSAKNARESHYRYLLSKGFSTYIASRAIRECMGELE